jgi:serine/threonine protein kinase
MNLESLIGQTLDSKYLIERELGRGGMGAVYLSTHVGTERPVALKVIVPQFMERTEFVERFKREARAAGRLRHPNVVDVTDFGFAETSQGRVAYLVMEYLDGCTLGEILDEEEKLPLGWTLDILEQVCSAVHEAHGQGIIHRDLKPDNIWLEPNQRGGYTVKVLDFGIAKLEEPMSGDGENLMLNPTTTTPTQAFNQGETFTDSANSETLLENRGATMIGEAGTLIQTADDEKGTVILPAAEISSEDGTAIFSAEERGTQLIEKDEKGTRLIATAEKTDKDLANSSTAQLTKVGAVLGTPLYMSPEQCRGEKLTVHSDIYSLAVIAYQMLSGKTPFEGDFTQVMDSHKELPPPPLDAKKVPRKVKKVLFSALSKDTESRPPTAEAFASKLRSHSEGFGRLLQKALVIYSENLPKFVLVAILATLPHLVLAILSIGVRILASFEIISTTVASVTAGLVGTADFFLRIFAAAFLVGAVTWLVAQLLAVPLRPISIRSALKYAWSRWKALGMTVTFSTLLSFIGFLLCILPGWYWATVYMLVAPSIMMEGISGRAAFRRSKELIKRAFPTALAVSALVYIVPAVVGLVIGFSVTLFSRQLENVFDSNEAVQTKKQEEGDFDLNVSPTKIEIKEKELPKEKLTEEERSARRLARVRRETITQILMELLINPVTILIASLSNVILALMYFKMRQAGGESMQDLLAKFEDAEHPQSKWQHRIRERLIQSGRVSSTERK